ncbi:aminotransferase class III-fold pyridoxal phosphate-dependent enzyme [Pseudomonas sp. WHRI 8519]|uniref:aminotransferase family protein n=1 Tax=Pseudomonas sp. WHRI 8519 TaxID=3162567 RepID=UPI0032EC7B13
MEELTSAVFHAPLAKTIRPRAVTAKDCWIVDHTGKRYLDASSSGFVAILGHCNDQVTQTISRQMERLSFAHNSHFTSDSQEQFCKEIVNIAPKGISHAMLTTSGSTANEAALKLARQYHLSRGSSNKIKVLSRRHSYHGSTLGALSLTGSQARRKPFAPYLLDAPQVSPPDLYRKTGGIDDRTYVLACAQEFEAAIEELGAENVSAIIVEPIAGAPLGALVSPPDYLRRVRQICDTYDVLLIVDEVVSGVGRSGDWFGIDESGICPDIITVGKGLGGGFVPIGGLLIAQRVHDVLQAANSTFLHSESFTGHPLLAATGHAVLRYIQENQTLQSVNMLGRYLEAKLATLSQHPSIGAIRGRGLLWGVELVSDKRSKAAYSRKSQFAERVVGHAKELGVLFHSGNGAVDGQNGDTVMFAPPYIVTLKEIDHMVETFKHALTSVISTG